MFQLSLSRQGETHEKFQPNALSRAVVKGSSSLSKYLGAIVPESLQKSIATSFQKPDDAIALTKDQSIDAPAFDMIRASVNLMVAGVLIAIATSMKLPLSTTYVTFMVAMGTSLADRAWGAESAVYRVAGVLNVIGGWFFTAFSAFSAAALVAYLLNLNLEVMFPILLLTAIALLIRSSIVHRKKTQEIASDDRLKKTESSSVQGVISESAANIANVLKRGEKIYAGAFTGLSQQKLDTLKKNKKQIIKLSDEVDELRDNIFYFIKNLDESSVGASNFYILILGYLQDMTQSLTYITKVSHKHVHNNHKKLKFNQIKELSQINDAIQQLFSDAIAVYKSQSFEKIGEIIEQKNAIYAILKSNIDAQVKRTRTEESSPKNTTLYFSLLLETKDLLNATTGLLEEYHTEYDSSIKPAKLNKDID